MLKTVVKLGAVALLLLGVTLCATHAIKDNYSTFKIRNVSDEKKDNKINGVEPTSCYLWDYSDDASW